MENKIHDIEIETQESQENESCLNCGTELKGDFCHKCGQEARNNIHTIKGFILEYIGQTYLWDSNVIRTLRLLVTRPGYLTNEFMAGKFVSQQHPLKLNLFLLLVFVTLFVFFSGTNKINDNFHDIFEGDERVSSNLQLSFLQDDSEIMEQINGSQRDTVKLQAPLSLATIYPGIISNLETISDSHGDSLDRYVASVPSYLIEHDVLVLLDNEYYHFNPEEVKYMEQINLVYAVFNAVVDLSSQYFPMLILFTAPFISFALRIVQFRNRKFRLRRFVFALHYTAFVELLIILIFGIYLITSLSTDLLQWILIFGSSYYLTMAFREVYNETSWIKSIVKALVTSVIYLFILGLIFTFVFIAACFTVVVNNLDTIAA